MTMKPCMMMSVSTAQLSQTLWNGALFIIAGFSIATSLMTVFMIAHFVAQVDTLAVLLFLMYLFCYELSSGTLCILLSLLIMSVSMFMFAFIMSVMFLCFFFFFAIQKYCGKT